MPNAFPSQGLPNVFVLLGTYNATEYLSEFVRSVRGQSWANWQMLVRDDASGDATGDMLGELAAKETRLTILRDDLGRRGPAGNYATLLEHARRLGAEYVFLADQDDVWLPEKIERQMELMRETESACRRSGRIDNPSYGNRAPVLVYSDLTVVDSQLQPIHPSFFRHTRLHRSDREALKTLLAHNFIPGCVMLLNRPLLELALLVPSSVPMHDWWLALCAASAGRLAFLPQPTVLYRQHGGNTVGAQTVWANLHAAWMDRRKRWRQATGDFARHVEQARALQRRLHERTPGCHIESQRLLDRFCRLLEKPAGVFDRLDGMRRLSIPKTGPLRTLWFHARMLAFDRTVGVSQEK